MPCRDPDRRRALGVLGGATLGALFGARSAGAATIARCVLTPRQTRGPYALDPGLVRSDIAEGSAGAPLHLLITVVGVPSCTPLPAAVVRVWHADAHGRYSGYRSEGTSGETFLRGTQPTGSDGRAEFRTIYPGWYRGRAPHVHLEVTIDGRPVVTTQMYFPEAVSRAIYTTTPPYAERGVADTAHRDDMIFRAADAANVVADVSDASIHRRAASTIGIADAPART